MSLLHVVRSLDAPLAPVRHHLQPHATPLDDGWDMTGVLIFATSLLGFGGGALFLLLRTFGLVG